MYMYDIKHYNLYLIVHYTIITVDIENMHFYTCCNIDFTAKASCGSADLCRKQHQAFTTPVKFSSE
jgi:hypothetical protein